MSEFRLELYGSSHEKNTGAVLYGIPAGIPFDAEFMKEEMSRRRSRMFYESARREEDEIIIKEGIENGYISGGKIVLEIENRDVKSASYNKMHGVCRPAHADYAAYMKYGPDTDMKGGGAFSGRMTAPLVAAGAVCKMFLSKKGIEIAGRIVSVGKITDSSEPDREEMLSMRKKIFPAVSAESEAKMTAELEKAKKEGDSLGGTVECRVFGLAPGTGELFQGGLESVISKYIFAVPSVKGVEFGSGFYGSTLRGSENNDPMEIRDGKVRFLSNNHGGILGGLASGEAVTVRAALKPVPSISKEQKTVSLITGENVVLKIEGRHDVCAVRRAVPAVEAAVAAALCEILL